MVRKAGATDKKKGTRKNETSIPGVTDSADFLQRKISDPEGIKLDQSIEENANKTSRI